jgi:ubiquinone/menaquinone biosynthesis C-methylase UbiE
MSINESNFHFYTADSAEVLPQSPTGAAPADSAKSNTDSYNQPDLWRSPEIYPPANANYPDLPDDLEAIRLHWERRGRKYGLSPSASWVDETMLRHEGVILAHYLKEGDRVLDAGCANGYTTVQLARQKPIRITGIDYASSMIDYANLNLGRAGRLNGSASFRVGNFLDLDFPDNSFDKVITKRCMINLGSADHQKTALLEAWRVLKPGGLFLISEVTEQTADNLNRLRKRLGLETMVPLWHNCYLDEPDFLSFASNYFEIKQVRRFSSTYYVLTWAIYPFFIRNGQRNYRNLIHRLGVHLPQIGDWGLQKLFVLQKPAG